MTTNLHLMPKSKNEWGSKSTPPIRFHGVVLSLKKKAQGQFYLYILRSFRFLSGLSHIK
jgi:hypothetical protein